MDFSTFCITRRVLVLFVPFVTFWMLESVRVRGSRGKDLMMDMRRQRNSSGDGDPVLTSMCLDDQLQHKKRIIAKGKSQPLTLRLSLCVTRLAVSLFPRVRVLRESDDNYSCFLFTGNLIVMIKVY